MEFSARAFFAPNAANGGHAAAVSTPQRSLAEILEPGPRQVLSWAARLARAGAMRNGCRRGFAFSSSARSS
eukprot:4841345-Prymnesium_polylepis.1